MNRAQNTALLVEYAEHVLQGQYFSRDDASISCTFTLVDHGRRVLCALYVLGESEVWMRQITKTTNHPAPECVGTLGDMRVMRDLGFLGEVFRKAASL